MESDSFKNSNMCSKASTHKMILRRSCRSRFRLHQTSVHDCSSIQSSFIDTDSDRSFLQQSYQNKDTKNYNRRSEVHLRTNNSDHLKDLNELKSLKDTNSINQNLVLLSTEASCYENNFSSTPLPSYSSCGHEELNNINVRLSFTSCEKPYREQMARTTYDRHANLLNGESVLYSDRDGAIHNSIYSAYEERNTSEEDSVLQRCGKSNESLNLNSDFTNSSAANDDVTQISYSRFNDQSSFIEGNCGYFMLWRKWLYFVLSKPTHWDVENLSRISSFGKKKVISLLLLPLMLFLIGSAQMKTMKASNFLLPQNIMQFPLENPVTIMNDQNNEASSRDFVKSFVGFDPLENIMHVSTSEDTPASKSVAVSSIDINEIKILVQRLVFEELDAFQLLWRQQDNKAWTDREINKVHKEFSTLRSEFKAFVNNFQSSKAANDKDSAMRDDFRASSSDAFNIQLDEFNKRLHVIETNFNTVDTFFNNMKNCCHEKSKLPLLVQHQMIDLLGSLMTEDDTNPKLHFFRKWLFSNFIDSKKFSTELKALIHGVKDDQEVAKTAIMAALKEQINKLSASFPHSVESDALSESRTSKIEMLIKKAILMYDADKTGQTDYALESGGGSVVSTRCSETYSERNPRITILGIPLWYGSNSPRNAIQPGLYPGQCWAFKGTHGYLVIQLAAVIRPTGFVIEHIPKSISPTGNIASAPKDFSVYGLESEKQDEGTLLGKYFYDADGDPLQYFPVQAENTVQYSFVELKIHSNHGDLNYTCLYRFRIHGFRS